MTTSSNPTQRGLDAAPIVYALLRGHPASAVCENHIRSHAGWLTTSVTFLEAGAVLRQQIAAWESANLPSKGLARLLYHVRTWLDRQDQGVAQEFWNQTQTEARRVLSCETQTCNSPNMRLRSIPRGDSTAAHRVRRAGAHRKHLSRVLGVRLDIPGSDRRGNDRGFPAF